MILSYTGSKKQMFGIMTEIPSIFLIIMVLLFTSTVMAIEITEVELNPEGSDSGNEWVELYSESSYSLSDHYLQNNDGEIYDLNTNFTNYIVITLPKQWLDNTDEKVILKRKNQTIFETAILKDSDDDDFSWNLCNNEWVLRKSTKGEKNNCPSFSETIQENSSSQENNVSQQSTETDEETSEEQDNSSDNEQQTSQINNLNNNKSSQNELSQSIKDNSPIILSSSSQSENQDILITKQEKLRLGIIISFTILTI